MSEKTQRPMKYPFLLLWLMSTVFSHAQPVRRSRNTIPPPVVKDTLILPPKLFMNCPNANCHDDFVRTELSFFDFVRDRHQCDIEVLVTNQNTGAGGREYTLTLMGQNQHASQIDTLRFTTQQTDTDAMIRKLFVQRLKMGLVRFMAETSFVQQIGVVFPKRKAQPTDKPQPDLWRYWVFNISANATANGESNKSYLQLNNNFKIDRVMERSKFNFDSYYNINRNQYQVTNERISVTNVDYGLSTIYVRSLSQRWSAGGFYKGYHSVYQNIAFSQSLSPALEFSFFPVSEVTRRQFRSIYQIGVRSLYYLETTIYDKTAETLPFQQLTGVFGMIEPWGTLSAGLSGYQYLHDLSKTRLSFDMDVSWRIIEGLLLRVTSSASLINNQISLAKATGDPNQFLLNGRQLPTNFNYNSSVGLSYTFGSIKNSVVNPRFSNVNF